METEQACAVCVECVLQARRGGQLLPVTHSAVPIECADFDMYSSELWLKTAPRAELMSCCKSVCLCPSRDSLLPVLPAFFSSWPDFVGSCDYCGNFL